MATAEIIDGKRIADELLEDLAHEIKANRLKPKLATILVGEDAASKTYINNKVKACARIGVENTHYSLAEDTTPDELLSLIKQLNENKTVHGILVQMPLPKHIDRKIIIGAIAPEKDVDGFNPINIGRLVDGDESMPACTPAGIIHLLEKCGVALEGANAVVVGRSIIVGKPLAMLLLNRNATVTVCHSKTRNLAEITRQADVLCVAVGKPRMITANMVKPGAVVIDVGINRVGGRLVGDVDFESVCKIAGKITPVPGGVGPMTVASLMRNTVHACARQSHL